MWKLLICHIFHFHIFHFFFYNLYHHEQIVTYLLTIVYVQAGSFVLFTRVTQVTYWLLYVILSDIGATYAVFGSISVLLINYITSIYPDMVCSLNTSPTHFCIHGPWISGSSIRAGLYWSNYNENPWSLIKFPSLHWDIIHVCYSTCRRNTIMSVQMKTNTNLLSKLGNSWHNPRVNSSFI